MMRKVLLFVVVCATFSHAQTGVLPLLEEGKRWVVRSIGTDPYYPEPNYFEEMLKGDTVIGGIHFMREYARAYNEGEEPGKWGPTAFYLGEDGEKVYKYNARTGEPAKMFMKLDFSLFAGDDLSVEDWEWDYTVVAVGDTTFLDATDQQQRRYLEVKSKWYPYSTSPSVTWVEGIGSLTFAIDNVIWGLYKGFSQSELVECTLGDVVLYKKNAAEGDKTRVDELLGYNDSHHAAAVYDLQGRRLAEKPRRGLYIQGGRKYVVK